MSENKKDNYQILSLIGQGAYGSVYKARRKFTGQFVAIKSIKKKGKEEKDLKVMRDEIDILKKLKHQNIILLLDSFETPSQFILVTELGQGELFNIIEDDHSLDLQEIRKIAQQLVRALRYIHSNRITHRDMKPQNILMTSDGIIKLCDFGFARHMSYKTEVLTSLKGTPLYMAPQVVKQEPYNHTADLWSLGVILYELATGTPPFTAPNLISLVDHISKDPVIYPETITGNFKDFLKGLLCKDPAKRLGWPNLLKHPFIQETENEEKERTKKTAKFQHWVEENHYLNQDEDPLPMGTTIYARSISHTEEKGRDLSPSRATPQPVSDSLWQKYIALSAQQKGATTLRSDPAFLDNLLKVLEINLNEIVRVRDKRNSLQGALKALTQVLMKSRAPENKKFDNSKNLNIPNHLLGLLKGLLRVDGGRQFIDLVSDITKLIGLLSRSSFQRNFGIQMVYVRSFVPLMPVLVRTAVYSNDSLHQTLTLNLLRTTGIFANNASANHIRSFSFYKDLVEKRFVQECMDITRTYEDYLPVIKLWVQVLGAFMHPVYGDIECFPWKRQPSPGLQEYKDCATMLECVRQTVINSLLQADPAPLFRRLLSLTDDSALLPKISVSRISLQASRQSKEFADWLIQQRQLCQDMLSALSNQDQVVFGTACQLSVQLLRLGRQKKKQKQLEDPYMEHLTLLLSKAKEGSKGMLSAFSALGVLQQLLIAEDTTFFGRILSEIQSSKSFFKSLAELLSSPQVNKLEQMRKIQGSNYGAHMVGLYDSVFLFLHRLLARLQKDNPRKCQDILKLLRQSKVPLKISQLLCSLSSKTDISPRGLISLLMLLYDLVNGGIGDQFAEESFLQALIALLSEQQVASLQQWPTNLGGGEVCVTTMFGNLMKIFLVYLGQAEKEPTIVRIIHDSQLLPKVIAFTHHLRPQTVGSVITFILHLLAFDKTDSRDRSARSFVSQFIQASGMGLFSRFHLLRQGQEGSAALMESINLLSQIARHSKEVYEHIEGIDPFDDVKRMLIHQDPQVRSRVLNLIGNMCRHSNYFYNKLEVNGLLPLCISLCEDKDNTVKKFACVAIGNASFHDDTLYQALKPALPILVSLLKDPQEKTRSNAAAALGNLARNSQVLDREFINTGANFHLVNMLAHDKSNAARKVSVMAIINLLQLSESRKVLVGLQVARLLQKVLSPPLNSDSGLVKTAQKALEKCK